MLCRALATSALVPAALVLLFAASARASDDTDLAELVQAQGEVISQLTHEIEQMRIDQQKSEDRVRALEDDIAAGDVPGTVTPEYVAASIQAYESAPQSRLLLSGYGSSQLVNSDGQGSKFSASFSPIFHFRLSDRLHFMGEVELTVDNANGANETEVELEFAQLDYLLNDWATLSTGKLFLPYNAFGPTLHPSWINKLPSAPPIYGGHGGAGFVPILKEMGAMVSGGLAPFGERSKFTYAFFVSNGPSFEGHNAHDDGADDHDDGTTDDHDDGTTDDHDDGTTDDHDAEGAGDDPLADLTATDTGDEDAMAFGGRLGFLPVPNLELGASLMSGSARGSNDRFTLYGLDGWYALNQFELRAEFARLDRRRGLTLPDGSGYYAQLSYRAQDQAASESGLGRLASRIEPVVRWGVVHETDEQDSDQLAIGLNYWLSPSVALKLMYEVNHGAIDGNRFVAQTAFGF